MVSFQSRSRRILELWIYNRTGTYYIPEKDIESAEIVHERK